MTEQNDPLESDPKLGLLTPEAGALAAYAFQQNLSDQIQQEAKQKSPSLFSKALLATAGGYKKALKTTGKIANSKTVNSTVMRASTGAYHVKSGHAMLGALKNVETETIVSIIDNDQLSFKDKIVGVSKHVSEKFSTEAGVVASLYVGKGKVIGLAAGLLAMAPVIGAAATVCGTAAGIGAMYYLATHSGHKGESNLTDKVKKGKEFLTGIWAAHKGIDPKYQQMHDVNCAVNEVIAEETVGHDAHHAHHEGHDHPHESFADTLKKDVTALIKVFTHPKESMAHALHAIEHTAIEIYDVIRHPTQHMFHHNHADVTIKEPEPAPEAPVIEMRQEKNIKQGMSA
jgi:hypothetical protein